GVGEHAAVHGRHQSRARQAAYDALAQLVQGATGDDHADEVLQHILGPRAPVGPTVDDDGQALVDHDVQAEVAGQGHDREAAAVGQLERRGGQLVDVPGELDRQPRDPVVGQVGDPGGEVAVVVPPERVAGREQQL